MKLYIVVGRSIIGGVSICNVVELVADDEHGAYWLAKYYLGDLFFIDEIREVG
jgi:hypothetical protein